MRKILITFFLLLALFSHSQEIFAWKYLKIISREQWGADEQFWYVNSSYWKDILKKRAQNSLAWKKTWAGLSQQRKNEINAKNAKSRKRMNSMNWYLTKNFFNDISLVETQKYDGKNKLAWGIEKTNTVKNIVIHHTYSEYNDSFAGIKNIHKFHALSRQWGDVWYHYVIWYNGEVFEWRMWGDYIVAAHDTWNNRSTVWISIMWNYDKRKLTDTQYASLKKLVSHLTKKYWIDLNKKIPYHKECFWTSCQSGLETKYYFPIVWHKDWKATSCPWENVYSTIIPKLLSELQPSTKWYSLVTYSQNKKQKSDYAAKIASYNWEKIITQFKKRTPEKQNMTISKIQSLVQYELWWKKNMLLEKFVAEFLSRKK